MTSAKGARVAQARPHLQASARSLRLWVIENPRGPTVRLEKADRETSPGRAGGKVIPGSRSLRQNLTLRQIRTPTSKSVGDRIQNPEVRSLTVTQSPSRSQTPQPPRLRPWISPPDMVSPGVLYPGRGPAPGTAHPGLSPSPRCGSLSQVWRSRDIVPPPDAARPGRGPAPGCALPCTWPCPGCGSPWT